MPINRAASAASPKVRTGAVIKQAGGRTSSRRNVVVGIVVGEGCDWLCVRNTCKLLLSKGNFKLRLVNIKDIGRQPILDQLDVLIIGGGDDDDNRKDTREGRDASENHYGCGQRRALGKKGMRAIYRRIQQGLMYVGICAGAYLASAKVVKYGCGKGAKNLRLCEVSIHKEEVFAGGVKGAVGLHQHKLSDSQLGKILGRAETMRFDDSAVMQVIDENQVTVLATYKRPVLRHTLCLSTPRNSLGKVAYRGEHRYLRHKQEMVGRPAVVKSRLGKGKVLLFGPHPELHPVSPSKLPDRSARSVLTDSILHVLQERDDECETR